MRGLKTPQDKSHSLCHCTHLVSNSVWGRFSDGPQAFDESDDQLPRVHLETPRVATPSTITLITFSTSIMAGSLPRCRLIHTTGRAHELRRHHKKRGTPHPRYLGADTDGVRPH